MKRSSWKARFEYTDAEPMCRAAHALPVILSTAFDKFFDLDAQALAMHATSDGIETLLRDAGTKQLDRNRHSALN